MKEEYFKLIFIPEGSTKVGSCHDSKYRHFHKGSSDIKIFNVKSQTKIVLVLVRASENLSLHLRENSPSCEFHLHSTVYLQCKLIMTN